MAKKSLKQQGRPKKDNAGCMSGLISMFDFRQGRYTQRLLSHKRFESKGIVYSRNQFDVLGDLDENHEENNDGDSKSGRLKLNKASIKALIEEEMSAVCNSTAISPSETDTIKSNMQVVANLEKNHKHTSNSTSSDHDANDSDPTYPSPCASSTFDLNLTDMLSKFCIENNECQDIIVSDKKDSCASEPDNYYLKHTILQKALSDLTKAYLDQSSELSVGNEETRSKEFVDALQNLSSNKELFLKLLQDPNPLPMKHILELQNGEVGEHLQESKQEEQITRTLSNKHNRHSFFRKKDKPKEENPSTDGSHSRIIVLKPRPARNEQSSSNTSPLHQDKERVPSQFSLKDIKRRLKNMIGESKKERNQITMDGILHKVPYGPGDNMKSYCSPEHASQVAKYLKGGTQKEDAKEHQSQIWENTKITNPLFRDPDFYAEAKKHISEMVSGGGENEIGPTTFPSIPLGRMLEMPGFKVSSPSFSPGKMKGSVLAEKTSVSLEEKLKCEIASNESPLMPGMEHSPSRVSDSACEIEAHDSDSSSLKTQPNTEEVLLPKENNEIEECQHVDTTPDNNTLSEDCKQEDSYLMSELEPCENLQQKAPSISLSRNCVIVQKEDEGTNIENQDRASPVSVLEPFIAESINSADSAKMTTEHAGLIEPRQLRFDEDLTNLTTYIDEKETKLQYVRTLLEASGLNYKHSADRWKSTDQLLDPFVYDELEISFEQELDDSRLLFDCVNEVLVSIRERYIACSPWVSFITPNVRPIPQGSDFVEEVCERFKQHLMLHSGCTLDQVIRNDLESKIWMNVRLEDEDAVAEISEAVVEYIMEETILELWD